MVRMVRSLADRTFQLSLEQHRERRVRRRRLLEQHRERRVRRHLRRLAPVPVLDERAGAWVERFDR